MDKLKVEGNNDLVRDINNSAILNINKSELLAYRRRKQIISNKDEEINNLKQRMDIIEKFLKEHLKLDNYGINNNKTE